MTSNAMVGGSGAVVMVTVQLFKMPCPPVERSARNNVQVPLGLSPVKESRVAVRAVASKRDGGLAGSIALPSAPHVPVNLACDRSDCGRQHFDKNGCLARRLRRRSC